MEKPKWENSVVELHFRNFLEKLNYAFTQLTNVTIEMMTLHKNKAYTLWQFYNKGTSIISHSPELFFFSCQHLRELLWVFQFRGTIITRREWCIWWRNRCVPSNFCDVHFFFMPFQPLLLFPNIRQLFMLFIVVAR